MNCLLYVIRNSIQSQITKMEYNPKILNLWCDDKKKGRDKQYGLTHRYLRGVAALELN